MTDFGTREQRSKDAGSWLVQTDWQIVDRAAQGHAPSRDELARTYLPLVSRLFRRRWRAGAMCQSVDDATQEVFVELLRQGGVLAKVEARRPWGFRALLGGVVRRIAQRFERRRSHTMLRERADVAEIDRLSAAAEDALRAMERRAVMEWIGEAERLLVREPANGRESGAELLHLLRLRFHDGLPVRAIAAQLGVDPATVQTLLRRARRHFHSCLRRVVARAIGRPAADDAVDRQCRDLLSSF